MRIVIAFFLALRGLRESVLSTALMIVAVAVAVGFEVPSVANLQGYRREFLAQSLTDGFGDIRVRPGHGVVLHGADSVAARLSRLPGVIEATPVLGAPASIRAHGHTTSLTVLGVEPTGSLDSEASLAVLDALTEVCRTGAALLIVTHDPNVAARCARRLVMRDGRLEPDEMIPDRLSVAGA
jgi:ABC-type lipoprotein release transport system permease subunit